MPTLESLGIGWFDFIAVIALVVGFFHGRKRGMSNELLDVAKWLLIIGVGAFSYKPVGEMLSGYTHMDKVWAQVVSYLFIAFVFAVAFMELKKALGEKLVGAEIFGKTEFYFGMLAGMIRYGCMLVMAAALFNAYPYSPERIAPYKARQTDELGKVFFPSFTMIQKDILYQSKSGSLIREKLGPLMIEPTAPSSGNQDTIGKQRTRELDEVMGGKPSK